MASISISLHVPTDTEVMGIHWRPLYRLKLALRDGLNALADYATAMMAVIFILPAVLLWTATILLGTSFCRGAFFVGWRLSFHPSKLSAKRKLPKCRDTSQ
jgi:hypothetical protein